MITDIHEYMCNYMLSISTGIAIALHHRQKLRRPQIKTKVTNNLPLYMYTQYITKV